MRVDIHGTLIHSHRYIYRDWNSMYLFKSHETEAGLCILWDNKNTTSSQSFDGGNSNSLILKCLLQEVPVDLVGLLVWVL